MNIHRTALTLALAALLPLHASAQTAPTTAEVLANAPADAWRSPDPAHTLYLELPAGRVVIELAPDFAPEHARNIVTLAHNRYWDGLSILRSQDNYVVQWGDANAGSDQARPLAPAKSKLPAEFDRSADGLPFTALADGDVYAPQVGWSQGFPVGHDPATGRIWLTHCYGMVGAGRDAAADSSNGAELYVVIGHAPRHLDRNITVVGRVLDGMQWLSTLPRGTGALGFYEQPEQRLAIPRLRLASDVPAAERSALQVMRTDSASFAQLIEARRNRREDWFISPVGHVELCNVPIPVRASP
ncbi:MAG: peptidylprolyl isomerase [Gammaproteobacteria bacterium HGW-Gammaproteobacteria-4]|jgi:peptidylprolyl isomerase|nr:MAG: peptidylprolyl isomerase [Gammaproteobacteria bacterium HGW-Gammaproteobacteria-4]